MKGRELKDDLITKYNFILIVFVFPFIYLSYSQTDPQLQRIKLNASPLKYLFLTNSFFFFTNFKS